MPGEMTKELLCIDCPCRLLSTCGELFQQLVILRKAPLLTSMVRQQLLQCAFSMSFCGTALCT